jgi:hypothetical protein
MYEPRERERESQLTGDEKDGDDDVVADTLERQGLDEGLSRLVRVERSRIAQVGPVKVVCESPQRRGRKVSARAVSNRPPFSRRRDWALTEQV